jgi:hypothetical protein
MYSQLQAEAVEASAAGDAPPGGSAETQPAEGTAPAVVRRPSSLASLKAEIARAMQVAADRERERIDASVGDEETVQVEKIVGRAAAEAAELSKHADEDVSLVNAWYKDQVKRIRSEADRQIDDRRSTLEQSLTHHGSLIEAEIESVHVAVQGYRASIGAFFGRLAEERDPSAIARLAGDLPDPPDLDDVRAEARSTAMQALQQGSAETPESTDKSATNGNGKAAPERELVAVMDQGAVKERAGSLNGTSVVATAAVPVVSVLAEDEPWLATGSTDVVDASATSTEAAPQENVAARLIRALRSRSTQSESSEEE